MFVPLSTPWILVDSRSMQPAHKILSCLLPRSIWSQYLRPFPKIPWEKTWYLVLRVIYLYYLKADLFNPDPVFLYPYWLSGSLPMARQHLKWGRISQIPPTCKDSKPSCPFLLRCTLDIHGYKILELTSTLTRSPLTQAPPISLETIKATFWCLPHPPYILGENHHPLLDSWYTDFKHTIVSWPFPKFQFSGLDLIHTNKGTSDSTNIPTSLLDIEVDALYETHESIYPIGILTVSQDPST